MEGGVKLPAKSSRWFEVRWLQGKDCDVLNYRKFSNFQEAINMAKAMNVDASFPVKRLQVFEIYQHVKKIL